MNTPATTRLVALALALTVTLAMFETIGRIAAADQHQLQLVQTAERDHRG